MQDGDRTTVGTEITLFLNDESLEFCNEYRMREVIEKILFFHAGKLFICLMQMQSRSMRPIDEAELRDDDVVVETYS